MRLCYIAATATIFGALIPCARSAVLDDPRFPGLLRDYVAQCAPVLSSQGMQEQKAAAVCTCTFNDIAAAATTREIYERLMQAQPNPSGSPDDRRLYGILSACFSR